jgi:hypothetical protein
VVGENGQDDSLTARIASLETEVVGLRKALQTRTVIGQATGLIAAVQGCTPQQGFELLVRMSQHHNVKLHTIAAKLVDLAAAHGAEELSPDVRRQLAGELTFADQLPAEGGWPPDAAPS